MSTAISSSEQDTENKPIIFCPECEKLLLDAASCPNCGWVKPPRGGKPGSLLWHTAKSGDLLTKPYTALAAVQGYVVAPFESAARFEPYTTLAGFETATGQERWRYALKPRHVARMPVGAGDLVLVASQNAHPLPDSGNALLALTAATGQVAWQFATPAHSLSPPAIRDDLVFFTASDGSGYALDLHTGELHWQVTHLPSWSGAKPTASDDAFFVTGGASSLVRVAADGSGVTTLFEAERQEAPWFVHAPTWANGLVYATCWDKRLYAIDGLSGQVRWRVALDRGATTGPVAGPCIYVGLKAAGARVYSIRAFDRETGATIWQFDSDHHFEAPPLYHGGNVFAGDRRGRFYALDALTGEVLWEAATQDNEHLYNVPATSRGGVFFGDRAGRIYAVSWRSDDGERGLESAETYRAAGQWELAGSAAAQAGDYLAAAEDFLRVGQLYQAAQLFEHGGDLHRAAGSYVEAQQWDAALAAYRRYGDRPGEAFVLLHQHEFSAAGALLAELGLPSDAAAAYQKAGLLHKAAEQLALSGETEAAVHLYRSLNNIEAAARLLEQEGEIAQATAIWREAGHWEAAAQIWLRQGRRDTAAHLYEENGRIDQAVEIWRQANDLVGAGAVYERAEQWAQAASLYAAAGDNARAAQTYERAGMLRQAVEMYVRPPDPNYDMALALLNRLDDALAIAELLAKKGDQLGAAQAYLSLKEPDYVAAARCYREAGAWRRAARTYESAELWSEALACWDKAPDLRQAAQLCRQIGRHQEAAERFLKLEEWGQAAELYLDLGHIETATQLYLKAGQPGKAWSLLEERNAWDLLRRYAAQLEAHEREARACVSLAEQAASPLEKSDLFLAAARAFARAAIAQEQTGQHDPEAVAALWDQAAAYFEQEDELNKVRPCRREANRLRHWPELEVEVRSVGDLVEMQWHEMQVKVKNVGFGPAFNIDVRIQSTEFEGDNERTQHLRRLSPEQEQELPLIVRPHANTAGPKVPLQLQIGYVLPNVPQGERLLEIRGTVSVLARDSQHLTPTSFGRSETTPQQVYIFNSEANIFHDQARQTTGDYLEGSARKNEGGVEITRPTPVPSATAGTTGGDALTRPVADPTRFCQCRDRASAVQPGDRYCPDCGRLLLDAG